MMNTENAGAYRVLVSQSSSLALPRIWRFIGYDEANYTYSPEGRDLLRKIGSLGDAPYFIRTHFLLCNGDEGGGPKWGATNVVEVDGSRISYQWGTWDRIFDEILSSNCVPFVEIGFMPEGLSTAPPGTPYSDIYAGGWRFPPKSYEMWQEIVRSIVGHCVQRYGSREVSRWYWELWNEPDIFYWAGTCEEYCCLYDFTEAAVHDVAPYARLGGPATTNPGDENPGNFLRSFLEHCTAGTNAVSGRSGTRLDLVTFHAKGARYLREENASKQTPSTARLVGHVSAGLEILSTFPSLERTEIIVSECDPDGWAAGSRHDNVNLNFRNTEYYASYFANSICKLLDCSSGGLRVDGALTWAFEFDGRPSFEGLRTLSTNGIDKPILNAFRLFGRLRGGRLGAVVMPAGDNTARTPLAVHAVASALDDEEIAVLVVCHHDDWDENGVVSLEIAVTGLPVGAGYEIETSSTDAENSNAHTVWRRMGAPPHPNHDEMDELRRAARIESRSLGYVESVFENGGNKAPAGASGEVSVALRVTVHSVNLVVFRRARDAGAIR